MTDTSHNPLLADWTAPFGLPPFNALSDDDFQPAFEAALSESRSNIDAIAGNEESPTFENTIEALELADEQLGKVLSVFFNLTGTDSNERREALQREFSPKLAAYLSEISMNEALFARIDDLWQRKNDLELTDEQSRIAAPIP